VTYRTYLDQYPQETSLLLADMLISVTNFFRDHEAFETLERDVIPAVLRDTPADESLRAWVMGCATGEEAFSVAMLMAEESARHTTVRQFQIFASDIDERAINIARRGIYPASIITDVPPIRLRQHFDQHDDYYCVKKSVRDQVLFASHNILRDPPFSRMHLITCRNVLIYLDRDIQKKVFEMMHYALHPGGFLFLGNAESADAVPDLFTPIDKKHRIYRATKHRPSKYYVPPQLPVASPRVPAPIEVRKPEIKQERPVQHLHWQLLQDAAPPSVLIDRQRHLIYATKPAGQFLQPPHGEPSNNILSLVHHDLQLELRAALFQADQSGNPVDTQYIAVHLEARVATVRILVRPARRHHEAEGMTLLMFEESSDAAQAEAATTKATENAVALHLEEDLRNTQEQLRAVIDQYESTLADLKASNEELQAVNEELRSAMEELETSKEELQSVNEELVTVNVELKSKVDETTKANDDLQNFLAATEIATVFVDRNNCIKRYSKPALKLFSLIATDIDRPLPDITHRLDYPQMQEDIVRVFETLQPQEREVRSLANEWFIARFLPYRTAADRIDGIVLTFVNISRRKAAEEKLRESERRMRLIAASTRDYAISTMDVDGNVTSWNHGAERLFGYSEDEALGQSGDMLFLLEDRKEGAFQQELQRAMHEGRAEDDRWHVRKDGSHVFCSGITSPLIDKEIHGFVKIARDLTGTKRAQDQQAARLEWEQQERLRAQESARLRDEFFAVLSHELKQPLNLIQLRAEMLSRMPGVAELPIVAVSAAAIQSSVTSQVKIIDDLMDLSRLHTGKLSLNRTTVNFTELVAQMVAMADADAQQKNLALSFEPSLPETLVYGDLVRLEQIVWNLLSNALKFTGDGGTIQVRLDQQDQMACLEVADTGRGIALEFLPFVFDMFKQADSGTARQYGGMGIGLALVQELAKSHGGYVEAASGGIGQGAQFRVRLPLARIHAKASTASANVSADVTGKRILLVDDARDTLVSMVELLTMHGAEVTAAASAQETLQKVAQDDKPYHLIISDLGMPGMDGFVLLGELRKHAATADTPAIALSGFTRERDVERAMAHGYHAHARKPVAIDYLLALAVRISN
jgi:two-component system CheB/CheR fusion protein